MEMMFSEIYIYINIYINTIFFKYMYIYIYMYFFDIQRTNCIAHTLAGSQMHSTQVRRNVNKH